VFDHGISIYATAGTGAATLWNDAELSAPNAATVERPDQITIGSKQRCGGMAVGDRCNSRSSSEVPALRFGFLTSYTPDTGRYEFGPTVFTDAGTYNISLNLWLELSNSDHHLMWRSSWQKRSSSSQRYRFDNRRTRSRYTGGNRHATECANG
jgi:hypothetical protein